MIITWVTMTSTKDSVVEYGKVGELTFRTEGIEDKFVDGGSEKRVLYMHRVLLRGLQPNTQYTYHVGSSLGWSDLYFFKTRPTGNNWSPKFLVYGDMGNKNAISVPFIQVKVTSSMCARSN